MPTDGNLNATEGYPSLQFINEVPNVQRRRNVSKACRNCHKAHLSCDFERPCKRCVDRGFECLNSVQKKRGRKGMFKELGNLEPNTINTTTLTGSPRVDRSSSEEEIPVQSTSGSFEANQNQSIESKPWYISPSFQHYNRWFPPALLSEDKVNRSPSIPAPNFPQPEHNQPFVSSYNFQHNSSFTSNVNIIQQQNRNQQLQPSFHDTVNRPPKRLKHSISSLCENAEEEEGRPIPSLSNSQSSIPSLITFTQQENRILTERMLRR